MRCFKQIKITKISLAIIFICILFNLNFARASLIEDFGSDADIFKIQSENLKEPVNINFHETELSSVLLLLAKIADINLVFPQELDRKITIKLKDRAVFDAIKDLLDICKLKYNFERNTLSVAAEDLSDVHNQSIEILYNNAIDVAKLINETLFEQIKNSQPSEAPKPFATVFPNKNFIIISGNNSQISAAKEYIKKLDQKPEIDFYTTRFLKPEDAQDIVFAQFPNAEIECAIKNNAIYLRGNQGAVKHAIEVLKALDKAPEKFNINKF